MIIRKNFPRLVTCERLSHLSMVEKKGMKHFLLFLCIYGFGILAHSQETKSDQYVLKMFGYAHYSEPKPILAENKITIPFKRLDNLILLDAIVDGTAGTFILDTGAPHLVLNEQYFKNAPQLASISGAGITGSISRIIQSKINVLSLGGIQFENVSTDLIDLSHLEAKKGSTIFGLLGNNLFARFEMVIDYTQNNIILYYLNKKGAKLEQDSLANLIDQQIKIPLEINQKVILVGGEISGKKLRFCLDTGAETNILSSNLSKKVMSEFEVVRILKLAGASDKSMQAILGNIKTLKIGQKDYANVQAALMNLESLTEVYRTYIDGMLGFEFLSRSKVSINYQNQTLSVWD